MALARPRCGVVGVTRLNVIWVEIFSAGRVRPMGCVAEMVDPHGVHISRGGGVAANKQLAPPWRKARAATL